MNSQDILDNLVRDLTSVFRPRSKSEVRRRIEEYGEKRVEEEIDENNLVKKLVSWNNDYHYIEELLTDFKNKKIGYSNFIEAIIDWKVDIYFELQFCSVCNQMTNHLNNVCQKCK